jgi:hypothetical protein
MTKRLFDHDPLTGITEWFEYDDSDDTFTISTDQDVTDLIEANKVNQNFFNKGDKWGDEINGRTHVARLDLNTYMKLLKDGTLRDAKAFKRWLNDPDNRAFRARLGTV